MDILKQLYRLANDSFATLSAMLGGVVLILAVATLITAQNPSQISGWAEQMFGTTFISLLGILIFIVFFSWLKILPGPQPDGGDLVWLETGLQAANSVTTLALTYTLLGISLGIGALAEQQLSPETVHQVIRALTSNFSLAFMTTVVGLPTATVLRALLSITAARNRKLSNEVKTYEISSL